MPWASLGERPSVAPTAQGSGQPAALWRAQQPSPRQDFLSGNGRNPRPSPVKCLRAQFPQLQASREQLQGWLQQATVLFVERVTKAPLGKDQASQRPRGPSEALPCRAAGTPSQSQRTEPPAWQLCGPGNAGQPPGSPICGWGEWL